MNIGEYKEASKIAGYREHLNYIVYDEPTLESFLPFKEADIEVKIHVTKTIIHRHFESTGGIALSNDVVWFINCFLEDFNGDQIKPWISGAIRESIKMIASDDTFIREIIGMTFMFGVVEFYAKYRLGWRPEQHDHFDDSHKPYREMFISAAINKLKKQRCALAADLCEIDNICVSRLKERGIEEKRYTKARIADRLAFARNSIVHGESHSFYYMAKYIVLIYALFHYHSLADGFKYEGK